MSCPAVGQLSFLNEVFRDTLQRHLPASVVVLGAATGNGFEHIRNVRARRVIAVDIQREYLEILRSRFEAEIPGLQIQCTDFRSCSVEPQSVDLVSCALFLEYVDPGLAVEAIARWLRPGGVLSVVLQLASSTHPSISQTQYRSLSRLHAILKLVDPHALTHMARHCHLLPTLSTQVVLPSGKRFQVGEFRRARDSGKTRQRQ